jgi:hypothetical protein
MTATEIMCAIDRLPADELKKLGKLTEPYRCRTGGQLRGEASDEFNEEMVNTDGAAERSRLHERMVGRLHENTPHS